MVKSLSELGFVDCLTELSVGDLGNRAEWIVVIDLQIIEFYILFCQG